jgi:hypothetical protein
MYGPTVVHLPAIVGLVVIWSIRQRIELQLRVAVRIITQSKRKQAEGDSYLRQHCSIFTFYPMNFHINY